MSFDRKTGERSARVDLGEYSLIRYKAKGFRFEMIVDPEKAWLYRQGEKLTLEEIFEGFIVFENFSKGLKASSEDLIDVFETEEEKEIAKQVLEKGDLQITQEMRKRFLGEKIEEIVEFLVKHTVNPKTRAPHTPARIEKAMDEAGSRIDRNEPTKEQALRILKEISSIIPIKMEVVTVEFILPASNAGSLYGVLKAAGEVVGEQWGNDGNLTISLQIPAGVQAQLMEEISDKTRGKAQIRVISRSGDR
jgi:ribosome maturation protein SDO1